MIAGDPKLLTELFKFNFNNQFHQLIFTECIVCYY